MGKRSNFERNPRDFYSTPEAAVWPLLYHLQPHTKFVEPCAGAGALTGHLQNAGHYCVHESDIEPQDDGIIKLDLFDIIHFNVPFDCFITNPPRTRSILLRVIEHLSKIKPTWLLFDADWAHTIQAASLVGKCAKIVSVGRVKWILDSKYTGKDNACWYYFPGGGYEGGPHFFGR